MNRLAKLLNSFALCCGFLLPAFLVSTLTAQDPEFSQDDLDFFENKIRPLLVEHCLECHGDDNKKLRGGLRLTSRADILRGGESGPAVDIDEPEESLLLSAIHFDEFEMPPKGKLSETQIQLFELWIKKGLPDPRSQSGNPETQPIDVETGKEFWSFQPIQRHAPPEPKTNAAWLRTDIDRFILRRLNEQGITPVKDADRASLLRRVHLVLTGLPPSEKEIQQFVTSSNELDADLDSVINRLLDSPRFGERWGRHWLDVTRFAESSGGGRSLMFPHAWRYRDYVIESFNNDKPFDQFIREQIAGDLLPADSHRERSNNLVATGFLALGPTNEWHLVMRNCLAAFGVSSHFLVSSIGRRV